MTVHFIGAGPGASDLLTLRGRDLIAASAVCLYAGTYVAPETLEFCPPGARKVDTARMTLTEIVEEMVRAHAEDADVARLASGDPSVFSAMAEQMRRLDTAGVPYDVCPGVPAYAAAAAALGRELTVPAVAQTVTLTRISGRATPMPAQENLAARGGLRKPVWIRRGPATVTGERTPSTATGAVALGRPGLSLDPGARTLPRPPRERVPRSSP
jgi:precorrin-4/cobalt-precorrin-4 C11-methyltransferase